MLGTVVKVLQNNQNGEGAVLMVFLDQMIEIKGNKGLLFSLILLLEQDIKRWPVGMPV